MRLILVVLCLSMLTTCVLSGCKKAEENNDETTDTEQSAGGENNGGGDNEEQGTLIIYPEFDERIERDYMYTVSVTQGDKTASLPVYNHTVASRTTRSDVDTTADEYRRFSTFAFDPAGGRVRVDIKVNCDFDSYSVIPSPKNFESTFGGKGVISVYLDEPDYFMIRLNDKDSTLIAIFADEPETDVPTKDSNTTIIDGWYDAPNGVIKLNKPNSVIYIKPGAVLNGRICITADNCKVIGRGVILDPFSDIYNYDEKEVPDDGSGDEVCLITLYNANETVIDGVHLLNSYAFNINIRGIWNRTYAKNNKVTNVKMLSSQMSSDGLSFVYYNKDTLAEHCFVYVGDNAVLYEDGAHFKDILVGTTCNAIFPQTDVRDSSCEDIYVFRADDNIINKEYGGSNNQTIVDNHTITNLYAVDVTYTNSLLYVEAATGCVSYNGGTTIKNIYLPDIRGIKSKLYQNTVAEGNCEVNLVNISLNGKLVSSITTSLSGGQYSGYMIPSENYGWIGYTKTHGFSYTTTDDFNPNVKKHLVTVNYKNDVNVFVGGYQVFYKYPIIKEGDDILIPFEQTQTELRTAKTSTVFERNGINYVSVDSLVVSGMAKAVSKDGGKIVITPNYKGENLILPDSGILSNVTEMRASHSEITAVKNGDTSVYHVTANTNSSDKLGIHMLLNEAIKKYGTGNYKLTFDAKSTSNKKLTASIGYSNEKYTHKSVDANIGTSWSTVTLEFSVAQNLLDQSQIRLTVTTDWVKLADFDITNICLVKVN